jgi:quinol monooxygenase YgiN
MPEDPAQTVFCFFRVIKGKEEDLLKLCREHDQTLRRLGLCTDKPATLYRGTDEREDAFIIKLFQWKSGEALNAARRHPEVQRLWEAMEPLCESRDGRPSMEFPHVERVSI